MDDFTIHAPDIIVANNYTVGAVGWTEVLFYHYPAGGKIRKVAGNAKYTIEGLGVSLHSQ